MDSNIKIIILLLILILIKIFAPTIDNFTLPPPSPPPTQFLIFNPTYKVYLQVLTNKKGKTVLFTPDKEKASFFYTNKDGFLIYNNLYMHLKAGTNTILFVSNNPNNNTVLLYKYNQIYNAKYGKQKYHGYILYINPDYSYSFQPFSYLSATKEISDWEEKYGKGKSKFFENQFPIKTVPVHIEDEHKSVPVYGEVPGGGVSSTPASSSVPVYGEVPDGGVSRTPASSSVPVYEEVPRGGVTFGDTGGNIYGEFRDS